MQLGTYLIHHTFERLNIEKKNKISSKCIIYDKVAIYV